ncbi:pectinesterase inhibitor [Capsicum chacoense]
MAVSYSSVSFLIVSLLSIFFTITSVKADLIDSVCSKSSDKVVCFSALRDDPRSKGANPEGLAAIAIELSQKKATSVYNLVSALLKQTTDPKLKMRYSSCLESFNDAINNLGKLPGYLKSKDYYNLSTHASAAIGAPTTCDNNFLEAPAEVLQLRDASHNLRGLIDVILCLCFFL